MTVSASAAVALAGLAGLLLTIVLERFMRPVPHFSRPWSAWALHVGMWLVPYGLLVLLLGRPWFAAAGVLAFFALLVLVNNAKMDSLREPFIYQDYEYFIDTLSHPRLYIPFFGWAKFGAAALGFVLAVCVGLWGESVPADRFSWPGQTGGILGMLTGGGLALWLAGRARLPVSFQPVQDLRELGLMAGMWRYAAAERHFPPACRPFALPADRALPAELPHLVAIQSESFFDPRSLYPGIRKDVLAEFDALRSGALACGKLHVPAWGANTVRTEFSFLSGLNDRGLGVHRFNPYRSMARGWQVQGLAAFLKIMGYRTVCIHPYPAAFYRRAKVFPALGFDAFLDIRAFSANDYCGPYIGDMAVARKIGDALAGAGKPIFVFAITMENHGPLHFEPVGSGDVEALYTVPPPDGCEELTAYLRHIRNADRMLGALRKALEDCGKPAGLCWYGDHVPIMPTVYAKLGEPDGRVDYFLWKNRGGDSGPALKDRYSHELAPAWLSLMGLGHTASYTDSK